MPDTHDIVMSAILGILFLTIISGCFFAYYINNKLRYENFQATVTNLSDEQKCLHICGFEWPSSTLLENYKFCIEKCDRISERTINQCGGLN